MRTIKTQKGNEIINTKMVLSIGVFNSSLCDPDNNNNTWLVSCTWSVSGTAVAHLGEYSSEERALELLDELNEWLTKNKYMLHRAIKNYWKMDDYITYGFIQESIEDYSSFQMPKDNEELDVWVKEICLCFIGSLLAINSQ